MSKLLAWLKSALAWLAAHPAPLLAAVGGFLAVALFRKAPPAVPSSKNELKAAQEEAKAETHLEQARDLGKKAEKKEETVQAEEKKVEALEKPVADSVVNAMTDEELLAEVNKFGGV
jgi:hypothetical protein